MGIISVTASGHIIAFSLFCMHFSLKHGWKDSKLNGWEHFSLQFVFVPLITIGLLSPMNFSVWIQCTVISVSFLAKTAILKLDTIDVPKEEKMKKWFSVLMWTQLVVSGLTAMSYWHRTSRFESLDEIQFLLSLAIFVMFVLPFRDDSDNEKKKKGESKQWVRLVDRIKIALTPPMQPNPA